MASTGELYYRLSNAAASQVSSVSKKAWSASPWSIKTGVRIAANATGKMPSRRRRTMSGARAELETCGPSCLVLRPFHAVYLGPQLLEDNISCGKGLADELFGTLVGVYLRQDLNE